MDIIPVERRNEEAKAKQLRRAGIVPCCVYGGNLTESISIQMDQQTANKLFRVKRNGSKVQLKLEEQAIPVQIKDKTRNFADNGIEHISFQALKADQKVNSVAHIILENGDTVAGILEKMLLEVPYASLPKDMIDTVRVDLEGMRPGTTLTVGDIPEFKQETIALQVDADSMVVRIRDRKRSTAGRAEE